MADENDSIEIEIKDDPVDAAPDEIVVKDTEEPKPTKKREITPREGIQELKQKLDLERQARIEAENRERAASSQAHAMRSEVADNQHQLVSNTLNFVKQERATMKAAYSQALAAGDFDAAAAHAAAHPISTVLTYIDRREDGNWLCIPDGHGYPVLQEPLDQAMRG